MNRNERLGRESIWSVASGSANAYFAVFTTLNIMNAARVIWFRLTQAPYAGWSPLIDAILEDMGGGALGIAAVSIAITDMGRFAMVLAGMFEAWVNRRRERQMAEAAAEARVEARAEAWAEARAETDALWRAWNERQMDALAKGEPFDEPPPDVSRASENGR